MRSYIWEKRMGMHPHSHVQCSYPQQLEAYGTDGLQLASGHFEPYIHQSSQAQDEPVALASALHSCIGCKQAVMAGVIAHRRWHVQQAARCKQPGAQPGGG